MPGELSVRALAVAQGSEPFTVGFGKVEMKESGVGSQLGVVGPAVFFPVRTVGRNADEVVEERPAGAGFKRVHVGIRAGEPAGFGQIAVDRLCGQGKNFRITGNFHGCIPEPVIGEAGVPGFRAVSFQRIAFRLEFSAADKSGNVVQMQGAVGIEYVSVLDSDGTSAGSPDGEFRPPGDILPGIPGAGFQTAHREQGFDATGWSRLFEQFSAGTGNDDSGAPGGIVEAVAVPAGLFEPGVVIFPVAETVECDWAVERNFPGVVACQNGLFFAGEFEQEFRVVAPDRLVEMPYFLRVAVVQPVAENDAESIASVGKEIGEVVYEICGMDVIVRRSGDQFAVSDLVSVEPDFVVSESAKVQFVCFSPLDFKFFAEIRRGKDPVTPVCQSFSE